MFESPARALWFCTFLVCAALPVTEAHALSDGGTPASTAAGLAPRTLEDCYRAALQRAETVGIQQELLVQAQENYNQAFGSVLPTISATGSWLYQSNYSSTATALFPTSQPVAKITLAQPLFQGLKEFAGLNATKALVSSANFQKQRAMVVLFQDVSTNFYQIVTLEQDLRNIDYELSLYTKRVNELNQRVRIGRSRQAEVLTVQSAMASLKAQNEQVLGQLKVVREVFQIQTGLDLNTPIADSENLPAKLEPTESYLGHVEARPEIRSQRDQLVSAEEGIPIARAGHLPSLSVNGDFYLYKQFGDVAAPWNWDVQGVLTIPIYSGGVVQSKVRQAASQAHQSELALSQARKSAMQEILSDHAQTAADLSQLQALIDATGIAEKNFVAEERDYRLGLVANIDVLSALTNFVESRRAADRERALVKLDYSKLQAATAERPNLTETQ
ncbi:MAG: TolC family protein [Bdellovibrionota bacterium]